MMIFPFINLHFEGISQLAMFTPTWACPEMMFQTATSMARSGKTMCDGKRSEVEYHQNV